MVELKFISMYFFSGLGVILGLVVCVFAITWIFDRFSGSHDTMLTPEEIEERRLASDLTKRAGLAGMLAAERNKVIRHFFETKSYDYTKRPGVDDVEAQMSEAVKSTEQEKKEFVANNDKLNSSLKAGEEVMVSEDNMEEKADDDDVKAQKEVPKTKADGVVEADDPEEQGEISDNKNLNEVSGMGESDSIMPNEERLSEKPKVDEEASPSSEDAEDIEGEEGTCPICINEFDEGDKVITGSSCSHMFHYDCSMQWMEMGHYECPCCREDMITANDLVAAASEVLGEKRVTKLKNVNADATRRLALWEAELRRRQAAGEAQSSSITELETSSPTTPSSGNDEALAPLDSFIA